MVAAHIVLYACAHRHATNYARMCTYLWLLHVAREKKGGVQVSRKTAQKQILVPLCMGF